MLGGVAGHAGLFSSVRDVATFAGCLLAGGAPLLARDTLALFTRREALPDDVPGNSTRALGWDTPGEHSQAGRYFSARSFGHLGFTGTSLWIDPERQRAIVLLSNRTWPTREQSGEAIKRVRPAFHDAVVEALG